MKNRGMIPPSGIIVVALILVITAFFSWTKILEKFVPEAWVIPLFFVVVFLLWRLKMGGI